MPGWLSAALTLLGTILSRFFVAREDARRGDAAQREAGSLAAQNTLDTDVKEAADAQGRNNLASRGGAAGVAARLRKSLGRSGRA